MRYLVSLALALCAFCAQAAPCDVNNDGVVNATDLSLIRAHNNEPVTPANAVYDTNGDGVINIADWQYCRTRMSAAAPAKLQLVSSIVCDINNDGVVSPADLLLIRSRLNTPATGPGDPYDANGDGVVNVADMRYCQLRQTASTP